MHMCRRTSNSQGVLAISALLQAPDLDAVSIDERTWCYWSHGAGLLFCASVCVSSSGSYGLTPKKNKLYYGFWEKYFFKTWLFLWPIPGALMRSAGVTRLLISRKYTYRPDSWRIERLPWRQKYSFIWINNTYQFKKRRLNCSSYNSANVLLL